MKYFTLIRNNWKKSLLGTVGLCYGLQYLKSRYEISTHMRSVCNEVASYAADSTVAFPKRVLVIINPVANNKKAEKTFQQYCEPLLHLAGFSVEIFKTNYVGHAKSLIENIKTLPDAVVIAGGDGTTSEVVTGLLRRNDSPCPIVLLPLGSRNETALKYLKLEPKSDLEYIKCLSNTLLPMIHDQVRYENVIKFDVMENEENEAEKPKIKSIYGLNRFSWGLLRDIESVKDKYWYFGFLRYHAAVFFNSFSKDLNWKFSTNFVYTPPCAGCRNCFPVTKKTTSPKLYWSKLLTNNVAENDAKLHIINQNCNNNIEGNVETNQINISCHCNTDSFYELEAKFINSLKPGVDFIKSMSNITKNDITPSLTLKSRTIQLVPASNEDTTGYYSIDGEEYDVRPIKISIIPNAIKIFCNNSHTKSII